MKILYIPVTKKITEKNLINYFKCFLYDIYIILKNFSFSRKITKNTSGYIDSAIHSNAYTFELPYHYCIFFSKFLNTFFDGIFVNWKFTNLRSDKNNLELKLIKLSKKFSIKKVIVDGTDKSINTIKNEILDGFDFVIKREKNKSISDKKYLISVKSKVLDGRIFLTGKVDNPEEKLKLTKLAWETDGVRSVRNDIMIKEAFNFKQSAKDLLITSQLRTALILSKDIKATNYQIDTFKKKIYIYGIAITSDEKEKVIEEAKQVLDVKDVVASILLVDDLRIQKN